MPFKEGQPSLMGFLGEIPLRQALKKELFGGHYLRLWDYFATLSFQYESGAMLGRAKRDKISTLVNMLVVPEAEVNKFVKPMQDQASERLEKFRNELSRDPTTFYNFIFYREFERVVGLSLDGVFEEYTRGNKKVVKVFDQKVSLETAWPKIHSFGAGGIGFGSLFPELTERMYRNACENIDMDEWTKARKYGVDIPEKPDIVTLEEREESILGIVAAYTAEFYPELLDPLDLRGYLEV